MDLRPGLALILMFFSLRGAAQAAQAQDTGAAEAAAAELRAAALSDDDDGQSEALNKLQAAGERALPPLIAELRRPERKVREVAAWAIGNIDPLPASAAKALIAAMADADKVYGLAAAEALQHADSYPWLIKELRSSSPKARTRALYVLGKKEHLEEKHNKQLLRLLHDPDRQVRENAVWALGQIRLRKTDPLPELLKLLPGIDSSLCGYLVNTLSRYEKGAVNPEMLRRLADSDRAARRCSASYFAYLDEAPDGAVEALSKLLTDPEPEVRAAAAISLAKLAPDTPGISGIMAAGLAGLEARERADAAWGLSRLKAIPPEAFAALELGLEDKEAPVRVFAAGTLAVHGSTSPAVAAALAEGLKCEHDNVRIFSSWAMIRLRQAAAPQLAAITAALDDPDDVVVENAAYVLNAIGPGAKAAVPALVRAFGGQHKLYLGDLRRVLESIGPAGPELLPELEAALAAKRYDTVCAALIALAVMGREAAPAAPAVVRLLAGRWNLPGLARDTLARMGPAAVKPLEEALLRSEYPLSAEAAVTLGGLGEPGLAVLVKSLANGDEFTVLCAARALRLAGRTAEGALPELRKLGGHPSRFVQARAAEAVAAITAPPEETPAE